MLFDTKTVLLKDGRQAVFRSLEAADSAAMLENLRAFSLETDFLLRCPDECTETIEEEIRFLEGINSSAEALMIGCFLNEKLIGNGTISFYTFRKTRHRATLSLAILKDDWGLGIGTLLLEELTSVAKDHGITQLELDYYEENERARRLYEKTGFQKTGEIPNAIRLDDGTILKEIHMVKTVF